MFEFFLGLAILYSIPMVFTGLILAIFWYRDIRSYARHCTSRASYSKHSREITINWLKHTLGWPVTWVLCVIWVFTEGGGFIVKMFDKGIDLFTGLFYKAPKQE